LPDFHDVVEFEPGHELGVDVADCGPNHEQLDPEPDEHGPVFEDADLEGTAVLVAHEQQQLHQTLVLEHHRVDHDRNLTRLVVQRNLVVPGFAELDQLVQAGQVEPQLGENAQNYFPVPKRGRRVGFGDAGHGFVEVLHHHREDGVGQLLDHVLGVRQFDAQDSQHTDFHREVAAEQHRHALRLENRGLDAAAPEQQPLGVLEVAAL